MQSLIQSPSGTTAIPKWVSSALLLTDLYQKISTADARRKALKETTKNKKVVWKWFDDRTAKWQAYNEPSQKDIDSAFNKGEQLIRLTQSRRKYTIYLTKMIQVNEESHSRRPITRHFVEKSPKSKESQDEQTDVVKSYLDKNELSGHSLSDEQTKHLLSCCVSLCGLENIDGDTLHSCLRIILRLTRVHQYALYFAKVDGVQMLLNLKRDQGFNGFYSLASLLIRHILEAPDVLKTTIEKTLRAMTLHGAAHQGSGLCFRL